MNAGNADVSIIVPLYNDADTILPVLAALESQITDFATEIIVVDDGSTDGGPAAITPPVRLIRQPNAGPAAARNRGASAATGAIVLFLDSDCVPPPNWVADMAETISSGGSDAVMGTLRAANDGVVPRIVQLDIDERYVGMAAARNGVDFIAAPSCGILRKVFLGIGGFDERLRQAEDVELAYRLTRAGHRIAFVDSAPVAHLHQTAWSDYIAVKFRRAKGRLDVFRLFPEKRRHDSWTPLSFKLQFAMFASVLPLIAIGALISKWLVFLAAAVFVLATASGWPIIRRMARRQSDLVGPVGGTLIGVAYVVLRSLVVIAALLSVKIHGALRPSPD